MPYPYHHSLDNHKVTLSCKIDFYNVAATSDN